MRDAATLLLAHGTDPHRDTRRIGAGVVALAAVCLLILNVGLYQDAEQHLKRGHLDELVAHTESARERVRASVAHLTHEVRFAAESGEVSRAVNDARGAAGRSRLVAELQRLRETFGLDVADVVSVEGRPLGGTLAPADLPAFVALAERTRVASPGIDLCASVGGELVTVAAVVPDTRDVLVVGVRAESALEPLLKAWPGAPPGTGAFLVRKRGGQLEYITAPPRGVVRAGMRVDETQTWARGPAMAAEGVQSHISMPDRDGRSVSDVTRILPELAWGIVGQTDTVNLTAGLRGTLVGLLVLDLVMATFGLVGFWLWRRQTGLREIEVTRRHADRVQAIFDTAFDAILTFDRDGRVRTANRAAQALFGRGAQDMANEPIHRFLHWGPGGRPNAELPAAGAVTRCEALGADGASRPVEFSLGSSGDGDDLLYTAIVRDISERVEAERRIESFAQGLESGNRRLEEVNAQLEEASRLKSEFLANTSHELRTPLNGMIGFLQLVLDGMCDSPDEEREFLKQALQCSRHLLGLINDVLDIAKIEAGKLTLEIERVDVAALFDEVYTVTHVQAAQKGIALRFEPPAEGSLGARGDFGKIKQVLINLVGNSLKFTHRGAITVRAIPHPDLGHFMFEVQDTGIGIPKDRQNMIFEKFVQADGSTTRRYGGTGLGLAITRSLIELQGGIIGVHSEGEGMGTRMYFSLPVWRDAEGEVESDEQQSDRISGPAGGSLVLLVEDDAVFRRWLCAVLHQSGYRTVEARNAEQGWVLVRRMRPAVVVLDYALTCAESAGLRSGWDLAQRMTSDAKTRHIPLIFVTGFDHELKQKLRATAFSRRPEHLVKPIDGTMLVEKIQDMTASVNDRLVRVLMADDDPSVGAYIRKVLTEDRFHIESASNGEECLHILRTQPRGFDLLLLDLMMPGVSGYDVLREMTLSGIAPELRVLVLTNFPEPRNAEEKRLLEEGMVLDVLPKSSVHDNPQLLPHIIDWHLQVSAEAEAADPGAGPEERAA
ncbi:MAG TPA: response regulator [Candidatus Eisenbacteria bacterium]|nr:response regulator [Candidatus Eisenbacteria bacterium]